MGGSEHLRLEGGIELRKEIMQLLDFVPNHLRELDPDQRGAQLTKVPDFETLKFRWRQLPQLESHSKFTAAGWCV